jgi:hypothetical protein
VSCYIIALWRTLKISIPQGYKTLHFGTIWILKGKNAAQVDLFGVRFNEIFNGPRANSQAVANQSTPTFQ